MNRSDLKEESDFEVWRNVVTDGWIFEFRWFERSKMGTNYSNLQTTYTKRVKESK